MSPATVRSIGIIVGLLAGTIAALMFRGPMQRSTMDASLDSESRQQNQDSVGERISAPDPGRRSELKKMVAEAKKEEAWLKEFELTERSGQTVSSKELLGEPYIACFFFSTCPGTCTRQSNQMQLLQNKLKGKPIKLVSITVDPEIDTPEVLTEYADRFQAIPGKWLFLTGPLEYIVRVGAEKFFLGGVEKRGHPDRFCLVNAEGDLVGSYYWPEQSERDLLVAHANELIGSK
jgi:protein SCO1